MCRELLRAVDKTLIFAGGILFDFVFRETGD